MAEIDKADLVLLVNAAMRRVPDDWKAEGSVSFCLTFMDDSDGSDHQCPAISRFSIVEKMSSILPALDERTMFIVQGPLGSEIIES